MSSSRRRARACRSSQHWPRIAVSSISWLLLRRLPVPKSPGTLFKGRRGAGPDAQTKTGHALFPFAVIWPAGAIDVAFLMAPSVLLILRGRGVALAQRLLSRATHGSLAALRQARRCGRGNREAKCDCSSRFVEGEHCYLLC